MYEKAIRITHLKCENVIFETKYFDEAAMVYYRQEVLEVGNEEFYCSKCEKRYPICQLEVVAYTPN